MLKNIQKSLVKVIILSLCLTAMPWHAGATGEPTVTLVSPVNQSSIIGPNVNFTCSAVSDTPLQSATLYFGQTTTTVKQFRQDGSFAGTTDDAQIIADTPNTNAGGGSEINVDGATPHAHGLIRFPNLIGTDPDQIPAGSEILSASLIVNCFNPGNAANAYLVKENWEESEVTWNSRAAGTPWTNPGADGSVSRETTAVNWTCPTAGVKTWDATNFVQQWLAGTPNHGIVITDTGADGIDFYSSEHTTLANRPLLEVSYRTAENWGAQQTQTVSGITAQATFSATLEDQSTYEWNCEFANTLGQTGTANANFTIQTNSQATPPQSTDPNLKVAFIGDQGLGANPAAVLQLIENEGADMVVHQGDFEYTDNPNAWDQQINDVLGANYPYFASIGNHDLTAWSGYQQKLIERISRIPGADCTGDIGVQSICRYRGLFMVFTAPGITGSGHELYIRDRLAADNSVWSLCSWHKNQRLMQVGGKTDETGWGVYEECRLGGGILATAHEHSYSRTHLLSNFQNQTIASTSSTMALEKGKSFAFVSGLGGHSIRDQLLSGGWWASIYTSTQGADYGALFCSFHVDNQPDKARCYFKDIQGRVADQFELISRVETLQNQFNPVATAGFDQTKNDSDGTGTESFILDGSASSDPDGTIVTYEWRENGALIANAGIANVELAPGAHTVVLTVTDNEGLSGSDTVVLTVNPNQSPAAQAGSDQVKTDSNGDGLEDITLDGSASSDSDGSLVAYEWREGAAILATTPVANVNFSVGSHTVILTVTDNGGAVSQDSVMITVTANQPPVAQAGPDQNLADPDNNGRAAVTLDAGASSDPDGVIVAYAWYEGTSLIASTSTVDIETTVGNHTYTVTVTDNSGAQATDSMQVTVTGNVSPTAVAGPDQTVIDGNNDGQELIILSAAGSSDPDGTIAFYEWRENGILIGTGPSINVIFNGGAHAIMLLVMDNGGAVDTDEVIVTVEVDNIPPVIFNVAAGSVTDSTAIISWLTDENSDSLLRYGPALPPNQTQANASLTTSHSLGITGLAPNTTYYYEVQSVDQRGNTATDNNGGQYYSFTTQNLTNLLHVSDITLTGETKTNRSGRSCRVKAIVKVQDENNVNSASATVQGAWSGAFSGTASGVTKSDGRVTFTSGWVQGCGTYTFGVNNIIKTGFTYYPSANTETQDNLSL